MNKQVRNLLTVIALTISMQSNALTTEIHKGTISDYRINKLTIDDGLSQSSVLCFFQDRSGFVWIGTRNGLNRFDGYDFKVFSSSQFDSNSLTDAEIVDIAGDSCGNLYIGTRSGLNMYVKSEGRFARMDDVVPSGTDVKTVTFSSDGTLWIGAEAGLFRGVPGDTCKYGFSFTNVLQNAVYRNFDGSIMARSKNILTINCICHLHDDNYIVGTGSGAFIYNTGQSTFRYLNFGYLSLARICSIVRRGNEFFFATSDGLSCCEWDGAAMNQKCLYSKYEFSDYKLESGWFNTLLVDSSQNVWCGSRGSSLLCIGTDLKPVFYRYDPMDDNLLDDKVINSLMIDRSGVLWIGTENKGIGLLDLNRKLICRFDNIKNLDANLNDDVITSIAGDGDNTLYVGSAYNGVSKVKFTGNDTYTVENVPIGSYSSFQDNEILAVYLDSKKNLWISSLYNWITKISSKGEYSMFPTLGFVFSFFEDSQNNMWIGTWGGGFSKINPANGQLTSYSNHGDFQSISNDRVMSFGEDSYGNLWIGTKGGGVNVSPISLLSAGQGTFATYQFAPDVADGLSSNDVNCIFRDSRGNMWLGTGNGLNRFVLPDTSRAVETIMQNKGKFVRYTETDGMPDSDIKSILEDDCGYLWVGTSNGVARICLNDYSITAYSKNDGLQGNVMSERSCFKDSKGCMYFGGANGLSFFNPANMKAEADEPIVLLTDFKVSNLSVKPNMQVGGKVLLNDDISDTHAMKLWPRHKDFSIDFSAMRFTNVDNVRFAYRLKGYTDEWRTTDRLEHSAVYTNIREGKYVFQVKATNGNGAWSSNITELKIVVKPPFWRTKWSFLIYLILVAVMLFFFRRYSIIEVTVKNKLLMEAYEKQKADEMTESKMRFFTNISHEIRTPLSLISGPLDTILQTEDLNSTVRNDLLLVKKNVARLLGLTNKLLQLRKIDMGMVGPQFESVHLIPYLNDILEYFEPQFKHKEIDLNIRFSIDENTDEVWVDKEMMTTAIYNLISNAYKYTHEKGRISVSAFISDTANSNLADKKAKPGTRYMNIEVCDNGVGIPAKELPYVFYRFYQASNQASTGQAGSGIGLSIVKDYVEMHGGIVSVANKDDGSGTVFTIQLPIGTEHLKGQKFKDESLGAEQDDNSNVIKLSADEFLGEPSQSDNEKQPLLLVVEDESDMLSFLERNLSKNYRIITATDGKKAWESIQSNLPDMVISDIMMPEMDGRKLCSLIKSNIETCHIPVILLSAHAADEDIIEGYGQGADCYVSKPFAMNVLEAQVSQLLSTRKQLIDLYSQKILLKPRDITITSMDEKFLSKIVDIIEDNISDTDFDVSTIVDKMNMSHSSVLKKIKALTGVSLVEFVRRHRLNKAAMIFEQEKLPITEVAYMVGFSDPKYFSKCFSKQFGKTPTDFVNEAMLHKAD